MDKLIWLDIRKTNQTVLQDVYNTSIKYHVIAADNRDTYQAPRKTCFIVEINNEEDIAKLHKEDIAMSFDDSILSSCKRQEIQTCLYMKIVDKDNLDRACEIGQKHDYLLLDFDFQTNIPLELIIAEYQEFKTKIIKKVNNLVEAKIAFDVMEKGSDGVMITGASTDDLFSINRYIQESKVHKLEIIPAKVLSVQHIGSGFRACLDTTTLFNQNEGMIIGSTSSGGILISSETHFLPYMNLRPFRVNAGAVHSYVYAPGNRTEYITDLSAGSVVLACDNNGNAREVTIGRVKIEQRPLLKIEAEFEGNKINAIVQDDWHIRVLGMNDTVHNASCLQEGDVLAAYVCKAGRHVGISVNETIIEK